MFSGFFNPPQAKAVLPSLVEGLGTIAGLKYTLIIAGGVCSYRKNVKVSKLFTKIRKMPLLAQDRNYGKTEMIIGFRRLYFTVKQSSVKNFLISHFLFNLHSI